MRIDSEMRVRKVAGAGVADSSALIFRDLGFAMFRFHFVAVSLHFAELALVGVLGAVAGFRRHKKKNRRLLGGPFYRRPQTAYTVTVFFARLNLPS